MDRYIYRDLDYLGGSDGEDSISLLNFRHGRLRIPEEPRSIGSTSAEVSSSTALSTELGLSSVEWSVDD